VLHGGGEEIEGVLVIAQEVSFVWPNGSLSPNFIDSWTFEHTVNFECSAVHGNKAEYVDDNIGGRGVSSLRAPMLI
jgi:hypothetical protein